MCCSFIFFAKYKTEDKLYKIVQIQSASEYYVDFNNDGVADEDELVVLSSLQAFQPILTDKKSFIYRKNITNAENIKNYFLAEQYLSENLLGKDVRVEVLSKTEPKIVRIYLNNEDVAKILLGKGFAVVKNYSFDFYRYFGHENIYQIKKNAADAKDLKIYILNNKNNKYHELDCKYGLMTHDYKIVKESELPKSASKCEFCFHIEHKELEWKDRNDDPPLKLGNMEIYMLDFTRHPRPNEGCKNYTCSALKRLIKNSAESIDIAMYSIHNQAILDELIAAQKRGVKIRIVTEGDNYRDYKEDMELLHEYFSDIKNDNATKGHGARALMHHKFIIFDDKYFFIGSTNLTRSDLSGFNSNIALIINSPEMVQIYKEEFEQMFSKDLFHKKKTKIDNKENIKINADMTASIYFSPVEAVITNQIIPLVNNAKKYVYIPIFVFTHKEMAQILINAKKRGVDVRVIMDATGAWNRGSVHKTMREAGVPVKVENLAGKMHMKSIIIDDEITVIGSMNYTASGENFNDENILVIKNAALAKYYKAYFLFLWSFIPDKWLIKTPHAESWESVGSCTDGVDNDFDGKIDAADEGCKPIKSKRQ